MVCLISSIVDGGQNVLTFEEWISSRNLSKEPPAQLKDIFYANTHAANAGTATTDFAVEGNSRNAFVAHRLSITI